MQKRRPNAAVQLRSSAAIASPLLIIHAFNQTAWSEFRRASAATLARSSPYFSSSYAGRPLLLAPRLLLTIFNAPPLRPPRLCERLTDISCHWCQCATASPSPPTTWSYLPGPCLSPFSAPAVSAFTKALIRSRIPWHGRSATVPPSTPADKTSSCRLQRLRSRFARHSRYFNAPPGLER